MEKKLDNCIFNHKGVPKNKLWTLNLYKIAEQKKLYF